MAEHDLPITVPRNETFTYRRLVLPNQMEVVLVSDPETEKAAAAMDVRVGSFSDPDDVPGLAHFLEHMLFYSSTKYPVEDSYSKFLSEHGGSCNAYTATESTNYHFDVHYEQLEGALDRFAQFFISPLISEDGVEREINAVNNENSKNLLTDAWRRMQLSKHVSDPAHPYHKFNCGNAETLGSKPKEAGVNIRERVLSFYESMYSANLMKLVVYSRQSLDELQALVEERFVLVANKDLPVPTFTGNPFREEHMGIMLKTVPTCDGDVLELKWLTVPTHALYHSQPGHYLGHLLGHEGEGSIFAILKERGWCSSLSAGEGDMAFGAASNFAITIRLTEEGHAHAQEAVAICYQYIALIREQGVQEWIYEELKAVSEMRFHFRDKQEAYNYVRLLSSCLQMYPYTDVLTAVYGVPTEYNAEHITAMLDKMTPARARVLWASKHFEGHTDQMEPWYGNPFSLAPLSTDWLAADNTTSKHPQLALPTRNEFVPTNFALKIPEGVDERTMVVHETAVSRLWYKPDTRFHTPKGQVSLHFMTPVAYHTPESSVLTRLFTRLLVDRLNAMVYYAEIAGLAYSITNSKHGFYVTVNGYSHKLMVLVARIFEYIVDFSVDVERFEPVRERAEQDYKNVRYDQPYRRALYNVDCLVEGTRWHVEDYEKCVAGATPERLAAFFPELLRHLQIEALVTGNILAVAGVQMMVDLEAQLTRKFATGPLFPSQHKEARVVHLPAGPRMRFEEDCPNPEEKNNSFDLMLQVGPQASSHRDSHYLAALLELFVQVAQRPAFQQLRRIEQLGYIVFVVQRDHSGVRSLHWLLQSDSYSCEHLESRVEVFVAGFRETLAALTTEEFQESVDALVAIKLEPPKTYLQEGRRLWAEIEGGTHLFDRYPREAEALKALKLQDLLDLYDRVVGPAAPERRAVALYVRAPAATAAATPTNAPTATADEASDDAVATDAAVPTTATEAKAVAIPMVTKAAPAGHVVTRRTLDAFKRSLPLLPSEAKPPSAYYYAAGVDVVW